MLLSVAETGRIQFEFVSLWQAEHPITPLAECEYQGESFEVATLLRS